MLVDQSLDDLTCRHELIVCGHRPCLWSVCFN